MVQEELLELLPEPRLDKFSALCNLPCWPPYIKWNEKVIDEVNCWFGSLEWNQTLISNLTLSLPRVINFKFPLHLHQKYNITQYEELGFSQLASMFAKRHNTSILSDKLVQCSRKTGLVLEMKLT